MKYGERIIVIFVIACCIVLREDNCATATRVFIFFHPKIRMYDQYDVTNIINLMVEIINHV